MKIERIILCSNAPKGQGLAYYYYRAFKDVVGESKVFIVDEGRRNYGASILERGIRRVKHQCGVLSRQKYGQLVSLLGETNNLVILFNNADLTPQNIRSLAMNPSVYLVNYLSDSPYGVISSSQNEILRCIPYFHLVCTFAKALVPVLYQLGAQKVERIPFGYCAYTHLAPARDVPIEFPNKVVYFGTWSQEIESWVNRLTAFDFEIEGNGWEKSSFAELRKIGTKGKPQTDQNMVVGARKAGVVVNFTRAKHGCFHTMKTFELMAAGACVLSNFSFEQNEFFKENESMMYFNTSQEMIEKTTYLLNTPVEAGKLREAAIKNSTGHSYHGRCKQFLSVLENT